MRKTEFVTVNTEKDADRFRKAVRAYVKKATRTRETARETLVRLGTHTMWR